MALNSRTFAQVAAVFLVALTVRGAVLWLQQDKLSADPDAYRAIATELRTSGEFARRRDDGPAVKTAYRPPLYPLLLAAVGRGSEIPNATVAMLHAVLGAATVLVTFHVARCMDLGRGSWIAVGLVAFDPLLLNQSWLVMTETLATLPTLLAFASLLAWTHRPHFGRALLCGEVVGICILCRPTYLVWLGIVVVVVASSRVPIRSGALKPGWLHALAMALAAVAVVSPWAIRNTIVFDKPIATTTHGGYTLLLGNNPHFYKFVRRGNWASAWEAEPFHNEWNQRLAELKQSHASAATSPNLELLEDAAAYHWARESIQQDANGFLLATTYRLWQLVSPLPNQVNAEESDRQRLSRYLVAVWYLLLYVAAAFGLRWWWQEPRRPAAVWTLTLLVSFVGVHAFYWTNLRMRAPLMPLLCLVAAGGVQELFARGANKRSATKEPAAA